MVRGLSLRPQPPRRTKPFRLNMVMALALLVVLIVMGASPVHGWPYVDCSGSNPILALGRVTASYDQTSSAVSLEIQGNFTNTYWAQGYTAEATSQWRTSILATIMDTPLYRSEGPACDMIKGGCPTAPGPGSIQTSFNISQSAPFAELMVTLQIVGSNNQSIVCVAVLVEQTMVQVNTTLQYLPVALALYSGFISLLSILMRATVGNGFLGAVATYGLATEAIKVHTPGLFDIIFYTQFMLMTGQLAVNYPSFYPTFTSLFHWSFLQFDDTLFSKGPDNATYVLTYGGAGSVNQLKDSTNTSDPTWKKRDLGPMYYRDLPATKRVPDRSVNLLPTLAPAAQVIGSAPVIMTTRGHPIQLMKRQETEPSVGPPTPSSELPSPSTVVPPSPSPSGETTTTTTTTKSSRTTTKSSSPSKPSSRTPASTTTLAPVIPIITNPFTNTSGISVPHNGSRFGLESYAAAIGAYPSDLFLGTLVNCALAAGGSLVLSAMLLGVAWLMAKANHQKGKTLQHALSFVTGNLLRMWMLTFTPLALSAMYQLTIAGGAVKITVAAVSLLIFSVGATVFLTWRVLRASSELLLFEDLATLLKYGALYNTLTEEGTLFFLVTLLARFLWGLAVSMLASFGMAQVAVLMVVELGYMLVVAFKWPFADSSDNKFHLFLGIIRVVITGCSITYVHQLSVEPKYRQLFAYIQMALHLSVFIVIFALTLWNTIQIIMFWRSRHAEAWKGPKKAYDFEDPVEAEQGWVLAGRPRSSPLSRVISADDLELDKPRRFTVQSYSSLGDLRPRSLQHTARTHDSSDDETLRYSSPAERYRLSRLSDHRRSLPMSEEEEGARMDRRLEAMIPAAGSASAAAIMARSLAGGHGQSSSESDAQSASSLALRLKPPRDSYAQFQRMSLQQTAPDPRTRRMSDITRDGPYLYVAPRSLEDEKGSPKENPKESKGWWKSAKESLGGILAVGKSRNAGPGNGPKPKAFEVIRPTRRSYVEASTEEGSRSGTAAGDGAVGEDQLRELNSLGISRFFQESDRGYERNRNLFVANPSAMISRTGSLMSTVSGMHPKLNRAESGSAASIYSIRPPRARGGAASSSSAGASVSAGVGIGGLPGDRISVALTGVESTGSDPGTAESRRVSVLAGQVYPRNSAESHIAEALLVDAPLRLQGGGTLKVSRGPEKAVQYWHPGSGQYVESSAESHKDVSMGQDRSSSGSGAFAVLVPSPSDAIIRKAPVGPSISTEGPAMSGQMGSSASSPVESVHSQTNVAVSAGRMHEILDRMFSDHDSDTMSEGGSSTFSGKPASLHASQRYDISEQEPESRYDMLEPVMEGHDTDPEQDLLERDDNTTAHPENDPTAVPSSIDRKPEMTKRASSISTDTRKTSGPLMRTFSGPTPSTSSSASSGSGARLSRGKLSSSRRPLAHSPLHAPSVQLLSNAALSRQPSVQSSGGSSSDYLDTALNRNASVGTVMTTRTEDSYVTALSQPSDHDE